MIVRRAQDHIQLVTQPDHARLARRIMARCAKLARHPRRDAILHAIGEHDNGWAELDAAPSVDPATGRIFDFMSVPVPARHAVWPRGVARLRDDPWAAALVAHHAITVYDRFRRDAVWTSFFAGMAAARDAMLSASARSQDELLADYPYLRLGDLISLAFCTGSTAEQRFGDWTIQLAGTRVTVTPDAFGGAVVPFEIRATEIRDAAFPSDEALREALLTARARTLQGEAGPRP
jgi:hypothetical protein